MGDQQDGGALLAPEGVELVEDLGLDGDVEGGGGFVGDDEVGLEGRGDADHDALAHTARELERVRLGHALGVGQSHAGEDLDGRLPCLLLPPVEVVRQHLAHLVAHGDDRIQPGHGVLEDHGDAAAADLAERAFVEGEDVLVAEPDLAAEDVALVGEEVDDGHADSGLAGAGLADEGEDLAALDIEGDLVEGVGGFVARAVADGEVSDADEGLGHGDSFGPRPCRRASRWAG